MGETEKTPTIEQKSTFASKTQNGSDVEFVATIKFFINPSGEVKINAPGSSGGFEGSGGFPGVGSRSGSDQMDNQIGAGPPPSDDNTGGPPIGGKITEKQKEDQHKKTTEERPDKSQGKGERHGEKHDQAPPTDKFPRNREVDKQIPRIQGDCPISQFIPDPCKAIDDLSRTIKGFFSGPSRPCPPCPRDMNSFVTTPEPKPMITGELGQTGHPPASEIMDKEEKYEV